MWFKLQHQTWTNYTNHAERVHKTSEMCTIFQPPTFCFLRKEEKKDWHVFSRIGETVKKSLVIPNTIVNTSILKIFRFFLRI